MLSCWISCSEDIVKCILISFKDTINPLQLFVEKLQFFNQNNQWLDNIISLNSQFTAVLNGIICFSVRFCDNSLLCIFRFFLSQAKRFKVFQWQQDINIVVISVLSSTTRVSVFWNFNFIWGNVHYVPEINLISQECLIKAFYFPNKTI